MKNEVLVIAEAGVNHNGRLDLARQLIDVAVDARADFVKFQTFRASRLASRGAEKALYQIDAGLGRETQYEMLQRLELSSQMHRELIEYCAACGIRFLSTAFDIKSLEFLASLGQEHFKVPSGEITNLPYLRYLGGLRKTIIVSTGMATLGEVEAALDALYGAGTSQEQITLLHCTTEYPTPMAEVNLRAMLSMKEAFGVAVGYSDHTQGIEVPIAAVALGARVVEKHFTIDRNLPGPDHRASIEPNEFKEMVNSIRNIEIALGDGIKRVTPSEAKNKNVVRKSLVASQRIMKGQLFTPDNVVAKRPGNGLSPMRWDEVIGRESPREFSVDEMIEL